MSAIYTRHITNRDKYIFFLENSHLFCHQIYKNMHRLFVLLVKDSVKDWLVKDNQYTYFFSSDTVLAFMALCMVQCNNNQW